MPITLKHFYMIRHGETEHNRARIMAGSTESPLTENGKQQAKNVQTILKNLEIKPTSIHHSNLSRARDTAIILNQALNIDLHENPDLAEWHAGDWENVHYDDCPALLGDWVNPPNGETVQTFLSRIQRAKNKALNNNDTPVLIVSHGGVFRAFGKLYGINSHGVDNCTLYEFIPNPSNIGFPWDVWVHSDDDEPVREPAMIYSASESRIA